MFSLFLLFGILQILILLRVHRGTQLLFIFSLLCSLVVLFHHMTNKLGIRL